MTTEVSDPTQDTVHINEEIGSRDKILLKAVRIDLKNTQRTKSTITLVFGDRLETKPSERGKYSYIYLELNEAWDITNGEIVSVVWRSRCPLKRTCKIKIGIDKILNALHDIDSCSDGAHEFEYEHVYEDKKCKVTARCNVLRDPRYDPLPNIVRKVAQDAGKVESLRGRLGISATYLEGVLSVGYLVKEIHPVIGVSISLLSGAIKILEAEESHNQKIIDLIVCMSQTVDYIVDVRQFATVAQLKVVIEEANVIMRRAVNFVNEHNQRGTFAKIVTSISPRAQEELEELRTSFSRFKDRFDRGLSVQTTITLSDLTSQIQDLVRSSDDDKVLDELNMKHQTRALRCLDGTRLDLIAFILKWVEDFSESARNILWIYGYPGAGKSTLAMHFAKLLRIAHRLGVIVEFNRTTGVTAIGLWKSVARALAYEYRICREVIVSKLKSGAFDLTNATSSEIFNELVAEPLQRLTESETKIPNDRLPVIIIDALDECGGLEGSGWKARDEILKCFADWAKLPLGVKLIVTSRAEQDITQAFSEISHTPLEILTGTSVTEASTHDIQLYMKNEFKRIATVNEIPGNWPGDETIIDLSRRAEGVFIWATTALVFVDDIDPVHQLEIVMSGRLPSGNVYALYRQILEASFPRTYSLERFSIIVGAIVVLQRNLTPVELSQLLGIELNAINGIRKGLRTVLGDTEEVRFIHQSFVDFLVGGAEQMNDLALNDLTACPERFHINVSDAHAHVCGSLFRLMHKDLRFNVCSMPSSFLRNDELPQSHFENSIGRTLAYACQFWGLHLSNTQTDLEFDLINTFIREDFLSWIECLSVLRSLIVAVPALTSLEKQILSAPEQHTVVKELTEDAVKFIQYSAQAITTSVAHVYTSALAFAPKLSPIARQYAPKFKNILSLTVGRLDGWPAEQAVIRGHSHWVSFVAFSPDGKRLVTCSLDKAVRVWDVGTGQLVAGPFTGHKRHPFGAVYSTDGKSVVSVSKDSTIRTWRAGFGVVNGPVEHAVVTVNGIDDFSCVAFSHSRKYIASVQFNHTMNDGQVIENVIFVRDVATGAVVVGPFLGHKKTINCVAFSPNDERIASGSDDKMVLVWNLRTGKLVGKPLEGHRGRIWSISCSHDGSLIASGSADKTIRLWNVGSTSPLVWVYEGHTDTVRCVSFSSDDRWIVSGSLDCTVRTWDVETGQRAAAPFEGHTDWVKTVAISPDRKRIASGSDDWTVRIWDVEADRTVKGSFNGLGGTVLSVALSKDSKRIVSGSSDKTIRIWDTRTGQLVGGPFKVHDGAVYAVAYSFDDQRIVSGSEDTTVRVWDIATKETVMELRGHERDVRSVVCSNSGRYIVSASWDKTNRIWDARTGKCIHTLEVGDRRRPSIALSAVDRLMTDCYNGYKIYDVETGSTVIETRASNVYCMAFSHDGKLVATGTTLYDIRVWNTTTCELIGEPFEGHTDWVRSVAFSPDGRLIVSGSDDRTIRVWDVKTGQTIMGPFRGHTHSIYSVAFTHDNKYIVSGSRDGAIRVWSIEKTQQSLFTNGSEMDEDGWIKGVNGELLFWIPPRHRVGLRRPNNTRVINSNETVIELGNARWGDDWTQSYTP